MSKLVYSSSDNERLQILKAFYEKLPVVEGEDSIFTEEQLLKIGKYYTIFEKMKAYDDFLIQEQEKQNKEFDALFCKAKIFVDHYYQTMQMAIDRGELPSSTTAFYGLSYPFEIPAIETGDDLLKIADSLFIADSMRVGTGGKYFANPSIGAVKVWVEKFKEAWEKKTNKFNVKRAEVENIENIRSEADKLIYDLHSYFDQQYSDYSFEEQTKMFSLWGMSIEQGDLKPIEETEYIDIFFDEENTDTNTNENLDDKKDQKSSGGNTGINQLKFDLFFPEK
jgi:hypothetical protein